MYIMCILYIQIFKHIFHCKTFVLCKNIIHKKEEVFQHHFSDIMYLMYINKMLITYITYIKVTYTYTYLPLYY